MARLGPARFGWRGRQGKASQVWGWSGAASQARFVHGAVRQDLGAVRQASLGMVGRVWLGSAPHGSAGWVTFGVGGTVWLARQAGIGWAV